MKNMALTKDQAKETLMGYDPTEAPKYPYGLCIHLNSDSLINLGLTNLPVVGAQLKFQAVAKVTGINMREEQEGVDQCIDLQITDMEIQNPSNTSSVATKLYSDND